MKAIQELIYLAMAFVLSINAAWAIDVDDRLNELGVKISKNGAVLASEIEFNRSLAELTKLRRTFVSAKKTMEDYRRSVAVLDAQIKRMNQQSAALNKQLANVRDVATNNRLVGAINTLESQLRLAYAQKKKLAEHESVVLAKVSSARDLIVKQSLEWRRAVDSINQKYATPSQEIQNLIKQYNREQSTSIKLEPSSAFSLSLRKLDQLEADTLSEKIPLRREGKTYYIDVSINDQAPISMVVDSGASVLALPYTTAFEVGVKPGANDEKIRLVVADGRSILGYKMTIPTVRVGPFIAHNVECAVLGPEAVNATPLLGMSFLDQFSFKINTGESVLEMVHLGQGGNSRRLGDGSMPGGSPQSAQQTVTFSQPNWKVVTTRSNEPLTIERDHSLIKFPSQLAESQFLIRSTKEVGSWLPDEEVNLGVPGTIYIAMMTKLTEHYRNGGIRKSSVTASDNDIAKFLSDGWRIVPGEFETSTPEYKEWDWVVIAKEFPRGPITIPKSANLSTKFLYFFDGKFGGAQDAPGKVYDIVGSRQKITLQTSLWKLVPAEPKQPYIKDRKYHLTKIPKQMAKARMLVRDSQAIKEWLPNEEVTLATPGRIYVAVLTRSTRTYKNGGVAPTEVKVKESTINGFVSDGWEIVPGLETTGPDYIEWEWVVLARDFAAGPVVVPRSNGLDSMYVFFVE